MFNKLYNDNKLRLWLDISTHCNAKCPQCHRTNPDGLGKVDWLPVTSWTIDQFKAAYPPDVFPHIEEVQLCGTWGDPLMCRDFELIVEYILAQSDTITVVVNTNGSIRDEDWWWRLGVMGKSRVNVFWAIEGITPAQHAFYRRNTDLYKVLLNMEAFSAAGGRSDVFTVVFKHNEADLGAIAQMSADSGAQHIMFVASNRFYRSDRYEFVDNGVTLALEKTTLTSPALFDRMIRLNAASYQWINDESHPRK